MMNLQMIKRAEVVLKNGQPQIVGPSQLISLINLIQRTGNPEMIKQQMNKLLGEWGIPCSITCEMIALTKIRYWNMERNEAYRDADVMFKRHLELR